MRSMRDLRSLDLSAEFEEFKLSRRRKVKKTLAPMKEEKQQSIKQHDIDERREKVFEYILRGYNNRQMANALGVSLSTVKIDIATVKKQNADLVSEHNENEFIGIVTRVFNRLMKHAWDDYEGCSEKYIRANYLNLIRLINKDVISLFVDMGLVGKKKESEGEKAKLPAINLNDLPVEIQVNIQNMLTQYLVGGSLKTQLKEPEMNPIAVGNKLIGADKNGDKE